MDLIYIVLFLNTINEVIRHRAALVNFWRRLYWNNTSWHHFYAATGIRPSWAIGKGPYVCFNSMPDWMWYRDISHKVGVVRLAINMKAAIELSVPQLASELHDKGPIVQTATLIYHLHRLVGNPITRSACVRMALLVYHCEEFVTDPVGLVDGLVSSMCTDVNTEPFLDELGTRLVRNLEVPLALRQRCLFQPPTHVAYVCKSQ